jgi:hypothetical protein
MRGLIVAALAAGFATAAMADDAVPDLKGVWTGVARGVVFGSGAHQPGAQKITDPPRIREVPFTYHIDKQDGRLMWGTSEGGGFTEILAWTLSADDKTIIGADTDGYFHATLLGPDRMESCYAQAGVSPTNSIVAACGTFERKK